MKLQVFVHAEWSAYEKKYRYSVFSCDMSAYSGPLVGKIAVDFKPPSHASMVQRTIDMLKGKQTEIRADAQKKATELQAQIDDLLCLEHKPEGNP